MTPTSPCRRIGIIGAGRVAQAMATALHPHSHDPIHLWTRDRGRGDAIVAALEHAVAAPDLPMLATGCDLILIAVSDDALASVTGQLAVHMPVAATPFVAHMSGRSGAAILAPLAQRGALTAAVHPAMTFTGDPAREAARMIGARFVITADAPAAILAARRLVTLLGGIAEQVAETQRALYHAALCHAANHLVTLISGSSGALRAAGIADPAPLLAPLVRAALDNALARGMDGLSGPLLRGDEATIRDHLTAIAADCPTLLPPYRAMARATLDALGEADSSAALRRILD